MGRSSSIHVHLTFNSATSPGIHDPEHNQPSSGSKPPEWDGRAILEFPSSPTIAANVLSPASFSAFPSAPPDHATGPSNEPYDSPPQSRSSAYDTPRRRVGVRASTTSPTTEVNGTRTPLLQYTRNSKGRTVSSWENSSASNSDAKAPATDEASSSDTNIATTTARDGSTGSISNTGRRYEVFYPGGDIRRAIPPKPDPVFSTPRFVLAPPSEESIANREKETRRGFDAIAPKKESSMPQNPKPAPKSSVHGIYPGGLQPGPVRPIKPEAKTQESGLPSQIPLYGGSQKKSQDGRQQLSDGRRGSLSLVPAVEQPSHRYRPRTGASYDPREIDLFGQTAAERDGRA